MPDPSVAQFSESSRFSALRVEGGEFTKLSARRLVRVVENSPLVCLQTGVSAAADGSAGSRLGRPRVVAMAASTGGPGTIAMVLRPLPADFPVPILLVQHITYGFVRPFTEYLAGVTALTVRLAENGDPAQPGTVYVAPDGRHLGISHDGSVIVSDAPSIKGHRPSATYLYESVAAACGSAAIGIILTGAGDDGAVGMKTLHDAGALTIAQDEPSSIEYSMPGAAIALGAAGMILNVREMPEVVLCAVGVGVCL